MSAGMVKLKALSGDMTFEYEFVLYNRLNQKPYFGQGNYSVISAKSINNLIPDNYTLNQNYPNPFNPKTLIEYGLPIESNVNISIYDMLGRKVVTLVNGSVAAGYHNIVWDGLDKNSINVSSGVYFYKIIANDFVEIKKMLLIR